jgi:hypothetical protein
MDFCRVAAFGRNDTQSQTLVSLSYIVRGSVNFESKLLVSQMALNLVEKEISWPQKLVL